MRDSKCGEMTQRGLFRGGGPDAGGGFRGREAWAWDSKRQDGGLVGAAGERRCDSSVATVAALQVELGSFLDKLRDVVGKCSDLFATHGIEAFDRVLIEVTKVIDQYMSFPVEIRQADLAPHLPKVLESFAPSFLEMFRLRFIERMRAIVLVDPVDPAILAPKEDCAPPLKSLVDAAELLTSRRDFFGAVVKEVEALANAKRLAFCLPALLLITPDNSDIDVDAALDIRAALLTCCSVSPALAAMLGDDGFTQPFMELCRSLRLPESAPSAISDKAIGSYIAAASQGLLKFLDDVALEKFAPSESQVIFDLKTRRLWVDMTNETMVALTQPILDCAVKLGDEPLRRQISFFCKLASVIHFAAVLHTWRDDGEAAGTEQAVALTTEKANEVASLRSAIARLDDFVGVVCCAAGTQDLQVAIMHQVTPGHVDIFDKMFAYGFLLTTARSIGGSICDVLATRWQTTLSNLTDVVKEGTVQWEEKGEELLQPDQEPLVRALLTNPMYQQLASLAGAISSTVKILSAYPDIVDAAVIDKAQSAATAGLRCLSVTFTLYHVKVAWPQIKGVRNQAQRREQLLKQHRDSEYKDSWSCLPETLKSAVMKFGA